jgi:hypothetical protein
VSLATGHLRFGPGGAGSGQVMSGTVTAVLLDADGTLAAGSCLHALCRREALTQAGTR